MEETYDYIVLGTGLTECILSGLLSVAGHKVLHMDRNDYYGGESASLNLTQLFSKFRPQGDGPKDEYGKNRDYNIDLVPKFMMASGEFVKMLIHTQVTNYLSFKQIAGSYVVRDKKLSKVPADGREAINSPLMGLFEKRRLRKFLEWVQAYDLKDPATWQGLDVRKVDMKEVYKFFGLEPGTQDFIGHAMALHLDDTYLTQPAKDTYDRIILYVASMLRYGKSPYVYPLYGLGELPQAFARRSAIYGGTYMLSKPIEGLLYHPDGRIRGVTSQNENAYCTKLIGDPSYFSSETRKTGRVIRVICLMTRPIPGTDDADSAQVIIPQNQVGRKHDVYIAMVGSGHQVCKQGYYVAIVSTKVETENPEREVEAGLAFLGDSVVEKFTSIVDIEEPLTDGTTDNVYISKSYDATSHFETVCEDVKSLYKRATGTDLDLAKVEAVLEQAMAENQ